MGRPGQGIRKIIKKYAKYRQHIEYDRTSTEYVNGILQPVSHEFKTVKIHLQPLGNGKLIKDLPEGQRQENTLRGWTLDTVKEKDKIIFGIDILTINAIQLWPESDHIECDLFKSGETSDLFLGTQAQVLAGNAIIYFDGTNFRNSSGNIVTLKDNSKIIWLIDVMENAITFPYVILLFNKFEFVDMNGFDITIPWTISGELDIFDSQTKAKLNIYGHANNFKVSDSIKLRFLDSSSGIHRGIYVNENFIFVADLNQGLLVYKLNDDNQLQFISGNDQGGSYQCVTSDGNFIYTVTSNGLYSYSVDENGNTFFIDSDFAGGISFYLSCHADQNFVYAGGSFGIRSHSVDQNGFITPIHQTINGGELYTSLHGDQNFIYVVTDHNVKTYTVDQNGILTFKKNEARGGGIHHHVFSDGNFLYVVGDFGIRSYSIDSNGNFIFIQETKEGTNSYRAVWSDGITVAAIATGTGVLLYQVDENGILTLKDQVIRSTTLYWDCYGFENRLFTADQSEGLAAYKNTLSSSGYELNFTGNGTVFDGDDEITQ